MRHRVGGDPDGHRALHGAGLDRDVLEVVVLALVGDVVLACQQAQDLDRFLHTLHARLGGDAEGLELVLHVAAAGAGRAHAGGEDGASVTEHVERGPLVGEQQGGPERGAREAGGADFDALGVGGEGGHEIERVEARLGEDRVADPDAVPARVGVGLAGQHEHVFERR